MIGVALPTIDKESHLSCWGERGKKYDELFTNFNYSQLKQMFNEDKFENINEQYNDDYDDENEDDDELFGYTNLNIQFEDENPLDE